MINKVLFVEDDAVSQMLCNVLIKKTSFAAETIIVENGRQAIEFYETLLHAEDPDYPELVFLDLNMPVMDGWEFLEEFIQRYLPSFKKTKIIIHSSSISGKDKKRAAGYSIVIDFISKPLTIDVLESLKINVPFSINNSL